uniref:Titin n=1 Tax=Maylandia zebra TaxID=106582 RepID=A0A3P9CSF7_9CICH
MCVEASQGITTLLIRDSQRGDADTYTINVRNSAGSKDCKFQLKVVGKPGICTGPITFDEITADAITLEWGPPKDDGGAEVSNYIVEKRRTTDNKWTTVASAIQKTTMRVIRLHDGIEYIFRVFAENKYGVGEHLRSDPVVAQHPFSKVSAVNSEGIGEPAEVEKVTELVDQEMLPDFELDAELRRTLVVRVRASIRMFVPIKGRPVPEVTWSKDDANLKTRAHIDNTESYTLLVIPDCTRYDAGKYHLSLENVAGKKTGFVNVKVLDTPGPPVNLKPREITKNSITLQWEIPIIDGGSKIRNYIIEKRAATKKAYTVLSTTWQKCSFKIPDLEEGAYYYFRVSAENDLGVGEPAETPEPIRVSQAPSAPENLYVTDVTSDSASLAWTKPLHDGGSLITGYVIEAQKKDTDQWVHVATIKALDYTVTDLIEGAEYTFRIMAVNASGRSDPRESRPAVIKEQTSAPSFDLRGVYQKTIIAKAGDRLKVEIPVLGKPRPVVSWKKGDTVLKETQRLNIETTPTSTILNINEIKKKDGGQYSMTGKNIDDVGTYTVKLTNTAGEASTDISVIVLDKPGPPTGPIKLDEVTADSVILSWDPPQYDGGCAINNYIVEKRDTSTTNWQIVSATVARTTIKAARLKTGSEYQFRIAAENRYGKSSALLSDTIVAQYPFEVPSSPRSVTPSDSTGAITAKDEVDPPKIDLEVKYSQTVVVNAGETFKLEAAVYGKPVPTIHWLKEGQEITEAARLDGKYTLTAENASGVKSVFISVRVLDSPSPPTNFVVKEITKNSVTLTWEPPHLDGGSKIKHYIVEKRESTRK